MITSVGDAIATIAIGGGLALGLIYFVASVVVDSIPREIRSK